MRKKKIVRKAKKGKLSQKSTRKCKCNLTFILIAIIFGALAGGITTYILETKEPTQNQLIKEFYDVETATHVSPHHIRKGMTNGVYDFILVDLRSQEEYEEEHIKSAINIPAYKDRDHSDYGAVERIFSEFSKLPKDKDIIVYCYSVPCMTGRKVGKILADRGIYVKHLGIGWNEWRYFWTLWNHPHEWETTNVEDYIWKGKEAGPPITAGNSCLIEGALGC